MLCTVKWGKKVSYGGVFDLAVEQPQLFRKLPKNKQTKNIISTAAVPAGGQVTLYEVNNKIIH